MHDTTDATTEAIQATQATQATKPSADPSRSEFLANVSTELRGSLNTILGMAGLLSDTSLDDEQRRYLSYLVRAGDQLQLLLDDVIDLSRIDLGKLELTERVCDVRIAVADVTGFFADAARRKSLELSVSVDPSVPETIVVDGGRLRQVLMNLVANAIKFTNAGSVRLRVDSLPPPERGLRFVVEDTGIGMTPAQAGQLFQKFSHADASTRGSGTGLGLTISKRIADLMGGSLSVTSALGTGSSFTFTVRGSEVPRGA